MTVQEFRRFNRFYTNLIGALDYGRHLYSPYTLTEARLLYELANSPGQVDAADLRLTLSLDAGYLSRLLGKFEERELITTGRSEEDSRRRRVMLTAHGREAASILEERSQDHAGRLLEKLPGPDRARLVESMATIRELLGDTGPSDGDPSNAAVSDAAVSGIAPSNAGSPDAGPQPASDARSGPPSDRVTLRTTRPGDLGWMVQRNAELYAREYGFDLSYEALVAHIVAEFAEHFDPRWDRAWIAELNGKPTGQVMCVRDRADEGAQTDGEDGSGRRERIQRIRTARLRLLLVEPEARGHGIGGRLVTACTDFARDAGYEELVLWTNSVLTSARRIYERAGFELVAERPHHSFGQDLVGQDWRLRL
ncbi:helix-turn-helix domain-containing GNAT family N-acetyltransferase [Streptomyces purpurogeneiscleroticus]|uniref:helix-turn-helix domain-containing GNAT family N-acetyltransferase n=1 Tax=Streptomyces purpurogeneiscleroticus TaxID=68259 RepID=UPI001CC10B84|nr:helix-turn-helix domain-containing GNAT family N-acetyltransferase [Streptomyces purpurogeneiscleroticus]MBZ4014311.1 MarR family transcriptional regulator [Streptomyces purpurogeneiscleroticus]